MPSSRPVIDAGDGKRFDKPIETIEQSQWESLVQAVRGLKQYVADVFSGTPQSKQDEKKETDPSMTLEIDARDVLTQLHTVAPDEFPLPATDAKPAMC